MRQFTRIILKNISQVILLDNIWTGLFILIDYLSEIGK